MGKDQIKSVDRRHAFLRLFEAVMGGVFLVFLILVVPLKETGYMAVPAILIPLVLIVDGISRFRVLNKGIVIDTQTGIIEYPRSYSRGEVKLSQITSTRAAKTLHSGAQAGVSSYTYDIHLYGDFGEVTLIFSTAKIRDTLLEHIKEEMKKYEDTNR